MHKPTALFYQDHALHVLDQSLLPAEMRYLKLTNYLQVISAIKALKVRGAPLIGVAAAYGIAIAAQRRISNFRLALKKAACELQQARPTAVNLRWAVKRLLKIIGDKNVCDYALPARLLSEARLIEQVEKARSFQIGQIGARLIKNNYSRMTICNTGWLAAPGIGTALGVISTAYEQGKKIKVFVLETRPVLQGARLTNFELARTKIPHTLITDSMSGSVMDKIDIVLAGADRIARNGDIANKIGTLTLAITARYYKVPFYVAAPTSSFDLSIKTGKDIIIEERNPDEILKINNRLIAPKNTRAFNPAFDITPARLISGIITEKGIVKPPLIAKTFA